MAKLGSKQSATTILDARLALVRQWDKKEAIEYLLPQRIEDGKMYNFKNQVVMSYDGEDCVFHEDGDIVKNVSRVTDKFLNDFYLPINKYFGTASEQAKGPEIETVVDDGDELLDDGPSEKKSKKDKKKSKNEPIISDGTLIHDIKGLISNGELKAAKKLLKKNEGDDDFKKAKKLLKKAGK